MLTVAHAYLSSRNRGCLLGKQMNKDDLNGASRALLTHAFRQSDFENPTDLEEIMDISNCQVVQPSRYVDCTATLLYARIYLSESHILR